MMVNWTGDYLDTFHHVPASAVMSFYTDHLIRECLHAYGNRKTDIIEKGYEEAVQKVVNRGLMAEEETRMMAMKLMMAQLAESAQLEQSVSRNTFLQDFGSDDPEMRSMVAGIWDQVSDNAKILELLRKNPEIPETEIIKELNIDQGRREEIHYATDYLRFIVKRRKDIEKWRPLYFFKPIEISYEGSNRKTVLSPLDLVNKVFYLGLTASATQDYGPMPFNTGYPMVGLHVNAVNTILTQQFIRELPWWGIILFAMACALPVAYFTQRLHPVVGAGFMVTVCAGYFWLGGQVFNKVGIWLPVMQPVVSVAGTFLAIVVRNVLVERHEKKKLRTAFSTYVTPSVVKRVMEDPDMLRLGGQRRLMTAFFSDVAGFTAVSEQSTPEALVTLLNEYLDAMTGIIFKHEGTLDKYQGDGIMAFWNAPVDQDDHAYRACCAAIDSISCIKNDLRPRWKTEGKPLLSIRIGVNTGTMIVGNMGSRTRMNYTVMGDSVNLASRLESANKQYGTRIMISEYVMKYVHDRIAVRELDILRVKGKVKPVRVYEVLARVGEVDREMLGLLDAYNEGLKLYRAGSWKDAENAFASAVKLCKDDGPSNIYLQRCREFIKSPPKPDWDGVWTLTSK
jgi:class 3 adenylate cyclase